MMKGSRIAGCLAAMALLGAGFALGAAGGAPEPESWLGIVLGEPSGGGRRILAVVPGGPADDAGLENGDTLLTLGAIDLGDEARIGDVVRSLPPGRPVDVRFLRSGRVLKTSVVPVQRVDTPYVLAPSSPESSPTRFLDLLDSRAATAGIQASRMSAELRVHFGAPEDEGVLVTRVVEGSAGARAGFRVGDVFVRLGGTPLRTPSDLLTTILVADETRTLEAVVVREKRPLRFQFDLPVGVAAARPENVVLERYLEGPRLRENRVKMLEEEIRALQRRIRELEEQLRKVEPGR